MAPITATEIFRHEHKIILQVLDAVRHEAQAIGDTGKLSLEKLDKILDFFQVFVVTMAKRRNTFAPPWRNVAFLLIKARWPTGSSPRKISRHWGLLLTSMKLKKSAPVCMKNITGLPTSGGRIDVATGFYPHHGGFLPYKISCRGKKP
jgi:hypothetical protein